MKKTMLRIITIFVIVAMVVGMTGCFNLSYYSHDVENNKLSVNNTGKTEANSPVVNLSADKKPASQPSVQAPGQSATDSLNQSATDLPEQTQVQDMSREELELVADILESDVDTENMDDKELYDTVDGMLNDIEKPKTPTVDKNIYADDGSMKVPFDEAFPEIVEDEIVEFSDDALLIKVKNSYGAKPKKDMKAIGVVAFEEIVPLEKATWYKAKLKKGTDTQSALESVRELKSVELAEYDYKIKTSAIDSYEDLPDDKKLDGNKHKKEQWYLHHFGIPKAFKKMKTDGGDSSVVVAVIDTGVDYDHQDLSDNIWKNTAEIPGNNVDDDKNGYVDDYYGVNIVAGKGNGDDDNGHGTHVAGIIAAQNNKLGTVGIAYNVTIMPVKAAMASGYLLQSDIAKAVLYAYENGAEIINMSFGGAACSIAVQDALATAYTRCVLVASAGNDGIVNEPGLRGVPNYPAALTYVLGVMSVDDEGVESSFTNWDYREYNGFEYELYAPGFQVMSTLPNDKYGVLSGTSMAAPVVSAFAAILRSEFPDRDMYPTKFIYGQLASTSDIYGTCIDPEKHGEHNLPRVADLDAALTKLPVPDLGLYDYSLFDTEGLAQDKNAKNNGDGVIDAGETIALGLTLRNRWGMSENTKVTLDTLSGAGIADPYITIHNPTVDYGSVGTYSMGDCGKLYTDELHTGWQNPFYITVAPDCPNDYIFKLNVSLKYENALDNKDKTVYSNSTSINLTVRNGVILPSIIDEDMTLTPDNLYIIPNSTIIRKGATVRVLAGTNIQFWTNDPKDPYANQYIAYLRVEGKFITEGTKENPVNIYPSDLMDHYNVEMGASGNGYVSLKWTDITNLASGSNNIIQNAEHCTFRVNYGKKLRYRSLSSGSVNDTDFYSYKIGTITATDSVFYKIGYTNTVSLNGSFERCIFADCGLSYSTSSFDSCVFLGNTFFDQTNPNNKKASSATSTNSYISDLSKSNISVYYVEDKGITYISFSQQLGEKYLEFLNARPAIFETEKELNDFYSVAKNTLPSNNKYFNLNLDYDYISSECRWYDGSQIGDFVDKDGLTTSLNFGQYLSLGGSKSTPFKICATTSLMSNYLYEIQGEILPLTIEFPEYKVNRYIVDGAYQLEPITTPIAFEIDQFIFESSDESVVTVDKNGLVTPVGIGTADVYVYSKDRAVYNYVTFDIMKPEIYAEQPNAELYLSRDHQIVINTTNGIYSAEYYKFESSDESVVTVDKNGLVTPVAKGNATITVTFISDPDATCEITVSVLDYTPLESISFATDYDEVAIGESKDFVAVLTPENASFNKVVYSSSDESVATVDENGKVTAVASGTAVITATVAEENMSASVTITAYKKATSLALKGSRSVTYNIEKVTSANLPEVVLSKGAEPNLVWTSSNEEVVKLENGKMVFCKSGNSRVTVTDKRSGRSDYVDVYISATKPVIKYPYYNYNISEQIVSLPETTFVAGMEFTPIWESTNTDVAAIENGQLTLKKAGMTTLIVTDPRNGLSNYTMVMIADESTPAVKKEIGGDFSNCREFRLYQNGDLYYIQNNGNPDIFLCSDVSDVAYGDDHYNILVLKTDGTLLNCDVNYNNELVIYQTFEQAFADKTVKKMALRTTDKNTNTPDYEYFVITIDDELYKWSDNQTPFLYSSCVQDIYVTEFYAYYLSGNSVNYYFDNSYFEYIPDISISQILYVDNTEGWMLGLDVSGNLYWVSGPEYVNGNKFYECLDSTGKFAGLEQCSMECYKYNGEYVYTFIGIKDGDIYVSISYYNEYYNETYFEEPRKIVVNQNKVSSFFLYCDDYNNHFYANCVTEDGAIYGVDLHSFSAQPKSGVIEKLFVTQTNIQDGVLSQDDLVIKFDNCIDNYHYNRVELYADENRVISSYLDETTQKWIYNYCTVEEINTKTIYGCKWQEGVSYRVEINVFNILGEATTVSIEFVYSPEGDDTVSQQIEIPHTYSMLTMMKTAVVPVVAGEVHESQRDESILRTWTPETLCEALKSFENETQYNPNFYNNAILNRISTDTTVSHWLRILAPSIGGKNSPLGQNYWGTTNETAIELQMIDCRDFIDYSILNYAPYLTEAPEDTFPFVTSVSIFNKHGEKVSTVGNEEITVQVTFNRDMDTSIPLRVVFGSAYPYGDYEIEGQYINPRTWSGTYKLTTVIENGIQYFTISNGCSATDDLTLCTDRARFGFVIDTTAAQALIMQGTATDTGINLTWTQDDFDTLMGYNVYRATSEDGVYTRLNSAVIPADQMDFFDATVEPGIRYYYNFTVVKTDLTESTPSGKISIVSKDTMAPDIYHSPVYSAFTGKNLIISATVTDNLNIATAKVYYRIKGESEWRCALMNNLNDKYSAIIIADHITTAGLEYYIEAFDGISYTYKGSAETPYTVAVSEAIGADSLGDVNGDGNISNLDALMLLKAINDQLNLDTEQFARADLDGDGVLMAKEALRILQYVSGTVGTVDMRG